MADDAVSKAALGLELWRAYWRLIDAYDYTYVTINGAHNLTKESPVTGNG